MLALLFLISLNDGGESVRSYESPQFNPFGWSPNGKTVLAYFGHKDWSSQIAMISAADGSARIIKSHNEPRGSRSHEVKPRNKVRLQFNRFF
ncbi:MAG: hypothetical protein JXR73_07725 [Candidatus Omnitrophica bacterium]|nr:hypothetical protein [Candidatus Omnitrophota bacterium]